MIKIFIAFLISISIATTSFADGVCSGFFISSDGYIATAAHCLGKKITAVYGHNSLVTRIVTYNKEMDVMILKIEIQNQAYFLLNSLPIAGEPIRVYGYPDPWTFGWNMKMTKGKVLRVDTWTLGMLVLIAPGNSGGPIVDDQDRVIGVLTAGLMNGKSEATTIAYGRSTNNIIYLLQKIHVDLKQDFTQHQNRDKVVLLLIED